VGCHCRLFKPSVIVNGKSGLGGINFTAKNDCSMIDDNLVTGLCSPQLRNFLFQVSQCYAAWALFFKQVGKQFFT
jgi:hypothetical protein